MNESLNAPNRRLPRIVLVALFAAFLLGVGHLFALRFEKGDVYPAYSTFRSDPLGAKAFYLALENTAAINVRRNHYAFKKLRPDMETALLYLGAAARTGFSGPSAAAELDRFVKGGGHLFISFLPRKGGTGPGPDKARSSTDADTPQPATREKHPRKKAPVDDKPAALPERWGFAFDYEAMPSQADGQARPVSGAVGGGAGAPVSWHSGVYFTSLASDWKVLYQLAENPVVIERRLGRGSILLASDSYFLSNESLRAQRHPELLFRILAGRPAVVFDESHFGIRSQTGLVGLFRKYGLEWVLLSMMACLGLFVWKRATSFVPPTEEQQARTPGHYLSTRDYTTGLTSLLRRNIEPRDIMATCVAEWKKTFVTGRRLTVDLEHKLKHLNQVVERTPAAPAKRPDPVTGYNRICQILSERKDHEQTH